MSSLTSIFLPIFRGPVRIPRFGPLLLARGETEAGLLLIDVGFFDLSVDEVHTTVKPFILSQWTLR